MNQRQHLRYKITGRARLSGGELLGETLVRLIDISISGISFLSDLAIADGTRVQLALSVLGEHAFITAAPDVLVRYCILEKRMHRIGGQFIDTDAATAQALAAIVEARARVSRGS